MDHILTAPNPIEPAAGEELPLELHSGDRMTRAEFHRVYETMPEHFKAELIGGIVYVASPLKRPHGTGHPLLSAVLTAYAGHTPGLEVADNMTVLLSEGDEPQPDLCLRILPEHGGQTHDTEDEYVAGAPELVAEVAHSTRAIALHDKRQRYTQAGVIEYIVVCLCPWQLRWFDLRSGQEFAADADGIYRSVQFPGLWIHAPSLQAHDYVRLMEALDRGLTSPEHADFVRRLAGGPPTA